MHNHISSAKLCYINLGWPPERKLSMAIQRHNEYCMQDVEQ